jgi:hypothetical protein
MVAALALATIGTGWHELRNQRDVRAARESLRKLATLTIRNFPERNLDTPDLFWKAIGREGDPMRDPWGTAYQLSQREEAGARLYFWTSAGADALFATRDDVVVEVPYPAGPFSAPDPGAGAEGSQPDSMNAK